MRAILPALLVLGACQPAADRSADTADQPAAPIAPATPLSAAGSDEPPINTADDPPAAQRLLPIGEYRVAGADSRDIDLPHAITVSVSADTIAVASQCVAPRWTYRYVEDRLRTELIPDAICDRGRYPAEEALSAVFNAPQQITRTPAGGILVTGGGRSVTLFSQ